MFQSKDIEWRNDKKTRPIFMLPEETHLRHKDAYRLKVKKKFTVQMKAKTTNKQTNKTQTQNKDGVAILSQTKLT